MHHRNISAPTVASPIRNLEPLGVSLPVRNHTFHKGSINDKQWPPKFSDKALLLKTSVT